MANSTFVFENKTLPNQLFTLLCHRTLVKYSKTNEVEKGVAKSRVTKDHLTILERTGLDREFELEKEDKVKIKRYVPETIQSAISGMMYINRADGSGECEGRARLDSSG